MTNQERAADIIAPVTTPLGTSIARGVDRATLAAQALADAGLLMPDLPEPMQIITPTRVEFNDNISVRDGEVNAYFADHYGDHPATMTPDEAREQAMELLAAANYAEKGEDDA